MDDKLTNTERSKLAEYEAAIQHNLATFRETGQALLKIRDGLLYRATHGTFEKYCQEQWEMTRRQADRLIESSQVVETLSKLRPIGPIPTTESQARELVGLNPDEQRLVWQTAIETAPNGKITGAHIRETREALIKNPKQGTLPTLEGYRQAIADHVAAANHHRSASDYHIRQAIHLRDEAFKQYGVQIELPFEFEIND